MEFTTLFVVFLFYSFNFTYSQQPYEIDVFIESDKTIHFQDREVDLKELPKKIKDLIYSQPASKFETVIYNIYGDETLSHGDVMDVSQAMLKEYNTEVIIKKFLLNMEEIDLDGVNWQEKVKSLNLKALN